MQTVRKYHIIAAGDVFLKTKSSSSRPFGSEIESLFQDSHCVVVNLETVLADTGKPEEKAVTLRVPPSSAKYLRDAGVDVVNVANNHTMDYGKEGFRATCAALDDNEILYVGVLHQGEQKPYIVQIDGYKTGILGYFAGGGTDDFGIAPLRERQIQKDIERLQSRNVERIIVNLHWGTEYVIYPSPKQQNLARRIIDYGAHVIIGHHPHIVQGIETYKNGVIFYSLGNFNFKSSSNLEQRFPCARWGIIALISFSSAAPIQYECIPIEIDVEYRPCFASQEDAVAFLKYLDWISAPLKPQVNRLFWLREASWPHFCNHLPSFVRRIRKYGARHFIQMLRWLLHPSNYGLYLGLLLLIATKASSSSLPKPHCPTKL